MREFVNFTPEARYWIRTPEGKWHSVLQKDASWIYGMPKGYLGDVKVRGRVKEVAVLAVTPWSYTSKKELERGLGIVLWDWSLGAMDCRRVMKSIEALTADERQRTELTGREPSKFERSYAQLADLLCEAALKPNPKPQAKRRKNAGERYVIEFEDPEERWSSVADSPAELQSTLESVTGDARIARVLIDKLQIAGDIEYTSDMVADEPATFGIASSELEDVLADLPTVDRLVVYIDGRESNPSVRALKRDLMRI